MEQSVLAAPKGTPQKDATAGLELKAPLGGWLVPITDVPDPVFSGRILGDGFAIDPVDATLGAPCEADVTSVHRARHAVTLKTADGAEILMHIGLDTVALKGEGFTVHVSEGDHVRAGDALVTFDMDVLAQLAPNLVVPVILTSAEAFDLALPATGRLVVAGESLARIVPKNTTVETGAARATEGPAVTMMARIRDPHGIHARPAGVIAEIAKKASSEVIIRFGDRTASAASPVGLMLLDAQLDDELTIEAKGADAETVVRAIAEKLGAAQMEAAADRDAPSAVAGDTAPTDRIAAEAAPLLAAGESLDIRGLTAAPGHAVGLSVRLVEEDFDITEAGAGVAEETAALDRALLKTAERIKTAMTASTGQQADILAAHLSFAEDPDLRRAAATLIQSGKSAAFAWKSAVDQQASALRRLGNKILMERVTDLEDIRYQVLAALFGKTRDAVRLPESAILFARDIPTSRFAELDQERIAGIVLAESGATAHIAILAAGKGIPTIVAAGPGASRVPDGQSVIIEADGALARVNPPAEDLATARTAIERRKARLEKCRAQGQDPCVTVDGVRIEVVANMGGLTDVAPSLANGAEGCGLMRSEFLFLDRAEAPDEEEQLSQYQAVATALEGRPLIIRTLDAGADKDVPYVGLPKEENPVLGLRGVRMSLWRPELMRTQIRAILRVKPYGQTRILLPMVATLADLRRVRRIIDEETQALGRETPIEVGIMIEVPSSALIAERFAAEVDFFSVGTNDLTQYALAIDRTSARLADQLDPFHPAVLRLIGLAVEGAKAHGKWVGVCGSLASFPAAAPLLIGLGVTELSATANAVPEVKMFARALDTKHCAEIAQQALKCESGEAVRQLVATTWPEA